METDKNFLDDLELRSESVQDVLSRPPSWMVRWGNTLIFVLMLMILLISYFMKYPEFIPAPITVTSQNPPERIVARTSSKIEKILAKDHQTVSKNDILMVLQSAANYRDVLELKKLIDSLPPGGAAGFPVARANNFKLGELQSDYNAFAKAYQDERIFVRLKPYGPEELAAAQGLSENRVRIATLQQQLDLENAKLDLTRKNFERNRQLFDQGVISKMELENERIKYLQAQQSIKSINLSISQLQEGVTNLQKTQSGVAINSEKDKMNYTAQTAQLLEQLRKSLREWEQTYLITSSTDGTLSFQQFLGENQFVNSGDALLSVLPHNKQALVGRMSVPAANSGKIVPGEKVLIKLDNYRYQEFGIVEGRVQNISLTPDDKGNYYIDVLLPEGLKTSYNKQLPFDKELRGNAEIVTKDLRLIERFFQQIRELMGHQT